MNINFAVNSYTSKSLPLSAQRAVNCYAENEPKDAKSQVALFGAPGLRNFATVDSGPIRGFRVMNNTLYVVSGTSLYSISALGAGTFLGGGITGTAAVVMSDNGSQVLIVNGTNGYIYSTALGFTVISDPNFHPATSATFFDNYFVFSWDGTNKFFISTSLDGTVYNGTDFASAEVSSDNVVAVVNQQENLLVFGQTTVETWYDAGTVNFPFQRIDGGTIERGCAAPLTPIKEDNSVFFLGDDLIFYRLDGTIPRRVSQHAIEDIWRTYTTVTDAFTFSYTFEGHKFVVLTFPTANATWVLDLSTGYWHERESWDLNGQSYGRWRGNCAVAFAGKVLIGDDYSGQIGYLDNLAFTEFGNTMRLLAAGPPIHSDRKRLFMSRFELDVETGVGATVPPGDNPQIMLDWSDDGGRIFKPLQIWKSMGKIGEYRTRLRWLRMGQSRNRIVRVMISDPVRRTIIAASADLSPGM